MKVSLAWMKWYAGQALGELAKNELVAKIGAQIGAVEEVTAWGARYHGVVVARVVRTQSHPNAERLQVVYIDDGGVVEAVDRTEEGLVQVVCGAPNVRPDIYVAWVPPGATIPSTWDDPKPVVIEARELRGVMSQGMLASPKELDISDEHEGILEITDEVIIGASFTQLFELDDLIIDIENKMFTHRPDCFGQLGVAREIAGVQRRQFISPEWYKADAELPANQSQPQLTIRNEVPELVPRYMAAVINTVKVKPSPLWLQSYLKRVGIRPINNVVDITNYVMMLTAQPLHAFDYDKVIASQPEATMVVRRPKTNETLTLLDGKVIQPHQDAVVIANEATALALGGVMGGANSEIDAHTTRIILEVATFDMYNIRKTSMAHGIFTDAVTRFSKDQSPAQVQPAMAQAVKMLQELVGASLSYIVDDYPRPVELQPIVTTVPFINQRLGSSFTAEHIQNLLQNVEITVHVDGERLEVTPPFWRTDLEIAEDIVEEVGRLYGFDNLPIVLPQRDLAPAVPDGLLAFKSKLAQLLARSGANEVKTYSFVHGNLLQKVGQDTTQAFKLRNALSPDLQHYRLSITPSLLDKVYANAKQGFDSFALFELNKVHQKGLVDANEPHLPAETEHLALVMAATDKAAEQYFAGAPFFQVKRMLEYIFGMLGVEVTYVPCMQTPANDQRSLPFEPKRSAYIHIDGQQLGVVGEYRRAVNKTFKLPAFCAGAELDVQVLYEQANRTHSAYKRLSQFPSTDQDICFMVDDEINYGTILQLIKDVLAEQTELQTSVGPVDIYKPNDKADTKNVTYRITLQHTNRTLTTEEVNELTQKIVSVVAAKTGARQV